jgi:uncharacterized phage protein (TIGR02216 family)
MTPFPWVDAMRLGLGVLRLPPDSFWRMTPRELAAARAGLGGLQGAGLPLSRARLDDLQQRFPDQVPREEQKDG